jgi:DEAD/DEAH box helicase domain-containing protein
MRHAGQFFARPHEQARVALQNPYILSDQLCCAASELPLHDADMIWFGETMPALRDWLLRQGRLRERDGGSAVAMERWPAANVNIRNADGAPVALRDAESGRTIEQIPATRAPFEIHPGAVYLHQGDTYLVRHLADREALAQHAQLSYYTQPRDSTDIMIERVLEQHVQGSATLCLGVVAVTRQVTGYRRKEHYSEALLSEHDLALPPQTFRTQAVWWTLPEGMSAALARACGDAVSGGQGLPGALHAMEHAAIGILPLFAQCDRWDIGGLSTSLHPDTNAASIFVYDAVPGGVGIAQVGYEQAEAWWTATRDLLRDCPCAEGCPSCVQSPKCGSGNQPLSKEGARLLADALLGIPLPTDGRVVVIAAPAEPAGDQRAALLVDLRERLARARSEPIAVRRKALLIALRYRLALERAGSQLHDADVQSALDAIDQEAQQLLAGR